MARRRVESFLVRVVLQVQEDGTAEPEAWHGRIQRVSTGDARQFNNVEEILEFIRSQCTRHTVMPVRASDEETRLSG
ncbi:MAG TPA: hypothetical protein PKA05_06580 [Roseiflexaceae bacterium]|nr:hypothetical protein [Roseiflexaceae bacterium]HMP40030.1 hypothetical protein [Roseiflexaceae bacterium]